MPTKSISVPTFKVSSNGETSRISTKDLSEENLRTLHDNDPFMYYSVPQLLKPAMIGRGLGTIDANNRELLSPSNAARKGRSPSDVRTASSSDSTQSGTTEVRKSRISFEADPCYMMMEELELLPDDEDDLMGDDDDLLFMEGLLCRS